LNHGGDPATTRRSTASDPSSLSLYRTVTHHPYPRKNSLSTTILGVLRLTMTPPPPSSRHLLRYASQREYGESQVSLRPSPIDHQHPTRLPPTNSTSRESQCPLAGRNQLIILPGQKPRLSDLSLPSLRFTKQDLNAGFDALIHQLLPRGTTHCQLATRLLPSLDSLIFLHILYDNTR
jgi:hypothetical protein